MLFLIVLVLALVALVLVLALVLVSKMYTIPRFFELSRSIYILYRKKESKKVRKKILGIRNRQKEKDKKRLGYFVNRNTIIFRIFVRRQQRCC